MSNQRFLYVFCLDFLRGSNAIRSFFFCLFFLFGVCFIEFCYLGSAMLSQRSPRDKDRRQSAIII